MSTVSHLLAQAAQRDPELAAYYEFHRALAELHAEARREIAALLEMADRTALEGFLAQGRPLLAFEQLPIAAGRLAELAGAIAQRLADYYPDLQGQILPADADAWLALARRRFEENRAGREAKMNNSPLAALAADQALKPYLTWAAEQIAPHLDEQSWQQPYCPVCGGAPDFAFLEEETGARRLVCARCNGQWRYRRVGCPFCGASDPHQIVYYPSADEVYRLYVCQECRRYLKTRDLRKGGTGAPVDVERVTTAAMDAAARQAGYR